MSSKVKRKVTVENNETSEQPRRQSVFERLGPGNLNVTSQSQERSSRGEQMEKCRNWLKTGKCGFGSSCRFKHDPFPGSKRSKWDKDIDKKDLRHKVRNKREVTKEATAESSSPKRRGRKRSSSRNRRSDHDSKMKSTVVVTRPRSPASETEFRDKKRIQEASWEDDSDDWPVDAAQLDYKEELTLERKRQQLQRELELEIQKERMVNENVTITKTVSVSGSSSSSSDSDSESSSSDSSSSSSGDSDDSSSSSSSSSESSPVRPKKQIVNRDTREKYHDIKSTLQPKEKEQLSNRNSKPHGSISHTSTLSPDPASRKRWKDKTDKIDSKSYSQKTIPGSRSEGTLIGRKGEYHNVDDDVPGTSSSRSKGPRTPSPSDGRRPKQRSLVSSSFDNKQPRSRSKRRKKRRDPTTTDDINYGELHPPSTPPPLSSPNRMSVTPYYQFVKKPKVPGSEKVQLRSLESSSYPTSSRSHGQRGNIIPPHEREHERENRRNFAASPEMDKHVDRKLLPRDSPWQRIEKLPREEEPYNKSSPLRHGNERKRIPPKKRDLSSHRDSPIVKEKTIESPSHRLDSQRKPLSHDSNNRNMTDRRRRSMSPLKDREDREREEREREREEREREREREEREREEREREEREREEREREERDREREERERERRRIADDAERKKGTRSESLSRVKPPRDPAIIDNYAGKKEQSRRVPSPESRRVKGGSSKDVKIVPSKNRSTNSNDYWSEDGKQLPGKPLHRTQETRNQSESRHHHQTSERPESKERIVDRGRKRERDKSRANIRDESRSDKLKPRSPNRTQSPYRGHCPLRGAEITTPPAVRDRRYDRDVSLGREHGYVYGNKNMNEGRYIDDRYGMRNEPVTEVCRNPMYSPEQYRDTRYRREMGQPTDRYGNYIGKDPHGMNSRVETGYIQDIHMEDPLALDDRWGRNRQLPRDNWDTYGGMMDNSMSLMPSLSSGSEMQRMPYDPVEDDRYPVRNRHTDWSGSRQERPERQDKRDRIHSPSSKRQPLFSFSNLLPHRQEPKDQKPSRLSPAIRTHSPADFSPASGASEHSSHINKSADKGHSVKPKERQRTKVNRRQTREKTRVNVAGGGNVKTEKEKPSQTKKRQKSPSPEKDKEKKKKVTDDSSSNKKKEELKKESASPSSVSRKTAPTPPAEENSKAPLPPPSTSKTVETPAKSEVSEKKTPKDNEVAKIPDPEFSDWSEDDDDLLTQDISGEEEVKKSETVNGNNAEKTEEIKAEVSVPEQSDDKKENENKETPCQEDNKQISTSKEISAPPKIIESVNEDTSEMTLEEAVHYDPISDDELDAILGEQDDIDTKLSEVTEKHGIFDTLDVDWDSLQNRSQDFVPGTARKRFTTAKVLAQIGFSQNLTGPELTAKILNYCNKQIEEERSANTEENGEDKTTLTELKMEHPIAAFHVIINANKEERANVLYNLGPYRHALCARQDLQMRRLLCKTTNKVVDSSNSYQNHTVDTELYKLSLDLWRQKTSSTQQMIPTS